jgi:hypothetical protein
MKSIDTFFSYSARCSDVPSVRMIGLPVSRNVAVARKRRQDVLVAKIGGETEIRLLPSQFLDYVRVDLQ